MLEGQLEPATAGRHGVVQFADLRLLYHLDPHGYHEMTFHSPRLAKGGDRIEGRIVLQGPARGLHIISNGTGPEGVQMTITTAGVFGKRLVLSDPKGRVLATIRRNGKQIDADLVAKTFSDARRKEEAGRGGLLRVLEASVAMLLAARVEQMLRRLPAAMTGRQVVAGAAAGAAAAGAGAAAYHAARRRREG